MPEDKTAETLRAGEVRATRQYTLTNKVTQAAVNPVSATYLCINPDVTITGTADSGGTTTLVDAALATKANDFFNGLIIEIEDSAGVWWPTEITDFVTGTGTVTFGAIIKSDGSALTVAAATSYRILGYPLVPRTAATVAANVISYNVGIAVTGTPGKRREVWTWTRSDGSVDEQAATFEVEPSTP